jgi:chaperonin cofactor prefoldin
LPKKLVARLVSRRSERGGENTSEKKVVGRNVAIALGIICIILAVGLVGAVANYTSIISGKDNTIVSKDSQIQTLTSQKNQLQTWLEGNETLLNETQTWLNGNRTLLSQTQTWLNANLTLIDTLNTQITNLQDQISDLNSQISSLNSQITNLQSQVNNLTDIVNLAKSTIWVDDQTISQPASSYTYWTVSASYAGYVSVWVQTSTTTNTYVRVIYSSHGVNYDHQIGVGTGGTAVFPLLPCSSIEIRVGNTNLISGATETVTITYHY